MELGDDTLAVLEFLNESVEGGLRKRNDVGTILELGAQFDTGNSFNAVVTTGTGLWKVYGVLRKLQPGREGYSTVEQEFGSMLNTLREQLAEIVLNADYKVVKRFDEIYFDMTQGVIKNLVDLAHDLSAIKNLQRDA